jgi:hypothetical protein
MADCARRKNPEIHVRKRYTEPKPGDGWGEFRMKGRSGYSRYGLLALFHTSPIYLFRVRFCRRCLRLDYAASNRMHVSCYAMYAGERMMNSKGFRRKMARQGNAK